MCATCRIDTTSQDPQALLAQIAAFEARDRARNERIRLLEEENRWPKSQLFGRSSEKAAIEDATRHKPGCLSRLEFYWKSVPLHLSP